MGEGILPNQSGALIPKPRNTQTYASTHTLRTHTRAHEHTQAFADAHVLAHTYKHTQKLTHSDSCACTHTDTVNAHEQAYT